MGKDPKQKTFYYQFIASTQYLSFQPALWWCSGARLCKCFSFASQHVVKPCQWGAGEAPVEKGVCLPVPYFQVPGESPLYSPQLWPLGLLQCSASAGSGFLQHLAAAPLLYSAELSNQVETVQTIGSLLKVLKEKTLT